MLDISHTALIICKACNKFQLPKFSDFPNNCLYTPLCVHMATGLHSSTNNTTTHKEKCHKLSYASSIAPNLMASGGIVLLLSMEFSYRKLCFHLTPQVECQ